MNTIQHVFIIGMLEAKADQLCNNNNNYAKNGGEKKIEGFDLPSYKKIRSPKIKTYLLVGPFCKATETFCFGEFYIKFCGILVSEISMNFLNEGYKAHRVYL